VKDDLLGVRRLLGDDAGAADFGAGAAVVGTATIGAMPFGSARVHQSADVLRSPHRPRLAGHEGDDLATSSAEPPPNATTPSWRPARKTATPAATLLSIGLA